ncbi:MAG: tetratricopeptide repeat protein [Luteolibacter sp.]
MKTLIALIVVAFALPTAYAQSAGQQAESYYQKGIAAEKSGDPDAALEAYNAALKLNPQHANARYRAGQVKIHADSIKAKGTEAEIGAVVIPVYQLEDATVQESIDVLSLAMNEATEGKIAPNFIIEDPSNKLADKRVTLKLKNIPVSALLGYIHGIAGTKARFDEHAVVITPL